MPAREAAEKSHKTTEGQIRSRKGPNTCQAERGPWEHAPAYDREILPENPMTSSKRGGARIQDRAFQTNDRKRGKEGSRQVSATEPGRSLLSTSLAAIDPGLVP